MAFYVGIGPERGKCIADDYACEYAMMRCGIQAIDEVDPDFEDMFVEWFYSGNWIRKEDSDEGGC